MIKLGQIITLKPLREIDSADAPAPDTASVDQGETAEVQKLEKVLAGPLKNYLNKVNKPEELAKMLEFLLNNINPNLQKNAKLRPILRDLFNQF